MKNEYLIPLTINENSQVLRENDHERTKTSVSNNADNVSSEGISMSPPELSFSNNAPIQRAVAPDGTLGGEEKTKEGDKKATEDMPKGSEIFSGPVKTRVATSEGSQGTSKPEDLGSLTKA